MMMRMLHALLWTAVFLLPSCVSAQSDTPRADSTAIARLVEQVQAANNAGEVERWVGFFATDFVYMAPGAPSVTTRDELLAVAQAGFRHRAAVDIEPVEIRVHGDWAMARTRVTGTVILADSGRTVEVDVKQLVIYRKDERGEWRIARLSSNSNK